MMAATGTASLQYVMIMLHAVISKGTMAASKMKKLYPAATPNASSTYRPAKRMKGDEIGRYVTISARPKEPVVSTCYTRKTKQADIKLQLENKSSRDLGNQWRSGYLRPSLARHGIALGRIAAAIMVIGQGVHGWAPGSWKLGFRTNSYSQNDTTPIKTNV